jgi:hypothetical protein
MMASVAMLLLQGAAPVADSPDRADQVLAAYREQTRAEAPCRAEGAEIVVCANREADKKYRVPFVTTGSFRDSVWAQTERVLDGKTFLCGVTGPFLTGCGSVGIGLTVGASGSTRLTTRKLAP